MNKYDSRSGKNRIVAIRGAGDLASGVALRLTRCGFRIVMSELPEPLCIRRSVAFANAVFTGEATVEERRCRVVREISEVGDLWINGEIPLLIDPDLDQVSLIEPDVLIDARIMKTYRDDVSRDDAPFVIGLGPGFRSGENVHAVIETNRGHNLGRVFWEGEAEPNTGVPGLIRGEGPTRVIKAPCSGVFYPLVEIGTSVKKEQPIAEIRNPLHNSNPAVIAATLDGIVRGALYPGLTVRSGLKIMDIDPRGNPAHCFTVSDKALSIAGGVLEAILTRFPLNPEGQ